MQDFLQGRSNFAQLNGAQNNSNSRPGFTGLQGSKARTSVAATPSSAMAAVAARHAGNGTSCPVPEVELIQENGRITQIIVNCACGERILLNCSY